jgi:adenosyl cobinamide kinase/adenosyl cobinamide phosphate guanylyltransferase
MKLQTKKQKEYYNYIKEHKNNVKKIWKLVKNKLDLSDLLNKEITKLINDHDLSKFSEKEFIPYQQNFYPDPNEKPNKEIFEKAWKHHYENNPHHWEFWIQDGHSLLMPIKFIIEMLCDWSAMGLKFKDLPSEYYEKNKEKIKINEKVKSVLIHYLPVFDEIVKTENNRS